MYGSQDLEVCVQECRVTAEDDLFVATLVPTRDLRLLDLTELLREENVTEFESLDMAVHMLFLAGKHSYDIAREIALAAHRAGYDGLAYPSYFSLLRTGGMPFETTYGISHRRIPQLAKREKSKIILNIALFGRPIEEGYVGVRSINRLILNRVEYGIHFGPVGHETLSGVFGWPPQKWRFLRLITRDPRDVLSRPPTYTLPRFAENANGTFHKGSFLQRRQQSRNLCHTRRVMRS